MNWKKIAGYGLAPVTGGGSMVLANNWDKLTGRPSVAGAGSLANRKPMTAADVTIPEGLTKAFGDIGTKGQAAIGQNYADASARQKVESGVRGLPSGTNSYAAERMPIQQGLDVGGLEAALGGVAGNTAYSNAKSIREDEQNRALAEEAAALNKPSLLEQIFQGAGAVGKPIAEYQGARNRKEKKKSPSTEYSVETVSNPGTYWDPVLGQVYI